MGFMKTPGPTAEQQRLMKEQEKTRKAQAVEKAREMDKENQERQGFKRRLRGVFSLLSREGGFKGFDKETLG